MKSSYQIYLEQEYKEMRNLYLSMLDSGYWQKHSWEKKEFEQRLRELSQKVMEAA